MRRSTDEGGLPIKPMAILALAGSLRPEDQPVVQKASRLEENPLFGKLPLELSENLRGLNPIVPNLG